jgi:hypothetical protein
MLQVFFASSLQEILQYCLKATEIKNSQLIETQKGDLTKKLNVSTKTSASGVRKLFAKLYPFCFNKKYFSPDFR